MDSFLTSEEFVKQDPAAFVKYWLDPNRSGPEPYVLPSCIIYRTVGPKLAVGWSNGKYIIDASTETGGNVQG